MLSFFLDCLLVVLRQFDALIVDPCAGADAEGGAAETVPASPEGPFDLFPDLGQGGQATFQKFLFLGDDRNIEQVYVAGKRVL